MKTLLLTGLTCLVAMTGQGFAQSQQTVRANFIDAKGQQVGTATLTQMEKGVLIDLNVSGLPAGELAFHVHDVGKCEPNTRFDSAGPHYGPQGHDHGFHSAKGPHIGDMPNQFVGQDGKLRSQVINQGITLGSGQGSVFDQNGSALVIHAKADDYRSQPSGNAGDRLVCAVIEK